MSKENTQRKGNMMRLENENSYGQGQTEKHKNLMPAPILAQYGYIYSHTTRITDFLGDYYQHCWKNGEHNASIQVDKYNNFLGFGVVVFHTSGSGFMYSVKFTETEKYLKNRKKRLTRKKIVVD